jgi:hypothetical protein
MIKLFFFKIKLGIMLLMALFKTKGGGGSRRLRWTSRMQVDENTEAQKFHKVLLAVTGVFRGCWYLQSTDVLQMLSGRAGESVSEQNGSEGGSMVVDIQ